MGTDHSVHGHYLPSRQRNSRRGQSSLSPFTTTREKMAPESLATLLKYGYQSLFVLLFMEAIGLPVPGAIVLLAAGAASATGVLHPGISLLIAVVAMLMG